VNAASVGKERGAYRVVWGNVKETDHLENQGRDGRYQNGSYRTRMTKREVDPTKVRHKFPAFVDTVLNIYVPSNAVNFLNS
jgi:hypothetical protein